MPKIEIFKYFNKLNSIMSFLAILFLIFITLSVTMEVLLRFLFGYSMVWVVEVSEYALLWITFLGGAWVLKRKGHVSMDLAINRMNPMVRSLLNTITSLIGAVICLVLCWHSGEVTWDHYLRGAAEQSMLEIPKAPIMAIIPLGSFLLLVQFLRQAFDDGKTIMRSLSQRISS